VRVTHLFAATLIAFSGVPAVAHAAPRPPAPPSAKQAAQQFTLYDGSKVKLGADGFGVRTDPKGHEHPFAMTLPQQKSVLGDPPGPSRQALIRRLSVPKRTGTTGDVVVGLSRATVNGSSLGGAHH